MVATHFKGADCVSAESEAALTDPSNGERPCAFCAIVAGTADSSRVYEDEEVLAFLTLRPTRPGECLVIPSRHIDEFADLPDELATRIVLCAQRLAARMRRELKPLRVGYVVSGFGVPHAHLIIVPLHHEHDIISGQHVELEEGEVQVRADRLPQWSRAELDRMADRLRIRSSDVQPPNLSDMGSATEQ